jgi:hypothetical protein
VKLAELERYFASVATSTSGPPVDLDEVFKSSSELSARARLGIYNRGYHYRLLGALASVFARTERALGEAQFERLGLAYLARHPSEHPAIERVGRLFPQYLGQLPEIAGEHVDLAVLEWARLTALVAPDPGAILSAHGVDPVQFPSSRLHFVPSLTTLSLDVRALGLFPAVSESSAGGAEASSEAQRRGVAVWRKRHVVRHEALDALELAALELARSGASVTRFCALFESDAPAEDAARAFRVVSGWFAREWIERSEVVTSV